jgi:steroid 5-alpha reductase family enzyme
VCGLVFESLSDAQLARFIKTNHAPGAVCDVGFWKYSRHPNYFGEILMWWGIALPVLAMPYGFLALVSPITITLLILYVSGVPLLEARLMERPEYRAYAARTSVLIPLPPKK